MAFVLKGSVCEHCEAVVWTDTSGAYSATTNPGGYGGPGAPAAYTSFTSYTLEVWKPKANLSATANFTLDLLATVPVINADGDPEWTITAASLGENEPMTSGEWFFKASGVFGAETFVAACHVLFKMDVQEQIDEMLKAEPVPAKLDHLMLFVQLQAAIRGHCCGDFAHTQEQIDWLYGQLTFQCC